MADIAKKAVEKPVEVPPAEPKLAPAAASGDAGVQFLLALRGTHAANGDDVRIAEVDRRLAELGFTAK